MVLGVVQKIEAFAWFSMRDVIGLKGRWVGKNPWCRKDNDWMPVLVCRPACFWFVPLEQCGVSPDSCEETEQGREKGLISFAGRKPTAIATFTSLWWPSGLPHGSRCLHHV